MNLFEKNQKLILYPSTILAVSYLSTRLIGSPLHRDLNLYTFSAILHRRYSYIYPFFFPQMLPYIAYPQNSPWLAPFISDLVWVCYPIYCTSLLLAKISKDGMVPDFKPEVEWVLSTWVFIGILHMFEVFFSVTKLIEITKLYYCIKILSGILYHYNVFGIPLKISEDFTDFCSKNNQKIYEIQIKIKEFFKHPYQVMDQIKNKFIQVK